MRWLALPLLLFPCISLSAYSVLTHEAIVDSAWDQSISPLLLKRFPNIYAYGGCIIQDMGYYPFGSKFFSDLVHYVRSGDFVEGLILEAQDVNEYAFALGALAHYAADNNGHSLAVNRAVPMLYPKLRAKFGENVTYAENPSAHLKTEFGFDVIQVANGSYAPDAYHDFIGFEVSKPVLERAFESTYGLKLEDIFTSLDLALGTYRHTVSVLIPEMTKAAWSAKKDDIIRTTPGVTRQKFLYNLSRASYEKEWTSQYEKPGWFARLLGFVFRVVPKVGPFRALAFRPATARNRTSVYTNAGQYKLADKAYAKLLDKLAGRQFAGVPAPLRADIVAFYSDLSGPIATKKHRGEWRKTLQELEILKSMAPVEAARSRTE